MQNKSRPEQKPVTERAGYVPPTTATAQPKPAPVRPAPSPARPPRPPAAKRPPTNRAMGRVARTFLVLAVLIFVGFFAALALGAAAYISIAATVPDVSALKSKQVNFASTKVYDSKGNLLIELTDPTNPRAGLRQHVPINEISPFLKQATIATEDPNFYRYQVGFDPIAIVRVLYYAWTERDFISGGSTITQQVARNLILSPEERTQRTVMRKIREIIIANEISRTYRRDEILEIYLNDIYYSNQAYGIEAAAQTYFAKRAKDLTLAESSLLAGIPQSPVLWDPVRNKDNALRRQADVLRLMAKAGFILEADITPARAAMQDRAFAAPRLNVPAIAPHFFYYVRQQLDRDFGAKGLYRDGLKVYTSLDPDIQRIAEDVVKTQLATLRAKNVTNASVVVLRPGTGEILAMVGSADFNDPAIDGQVNVATSSQQPGSTVKPFVYLAAMQKGLAPSTLYWDVPSTFTNQYGQKYTPRNYDGKFHGPMPMREALGRSMNIPAVQTLEYVTVPDFLILANRFGLDFPPNPQYGLAITLGGAESTLLNLTGAYSVLANNGARKQPTGITRVEYLNGTLARDYTTEKAEQIVQPEYAYLITNILSDNAARAKSFGVNNVLNLPFPAAAKTGTTNDYRDNLAVGYTPDLTVGVWVGNNDNSAMEGVSGITGAAPIWHDVMLRVYEGRRPQPFARPPGIIDAEVCALGGRLPSASCPKRVREVFKSDQPPLPPDENTERAVAANDPALAAAPPTAAAAQSQSTDIVLTQPLNGQGYTRGLLSIQGTVNPPGFQSYKVEYGDGDNPGEWKWISGPHLSPVPAGQLTQWGIESLPPGRYTLRVTVQTSSGAQVGYSRFDVTP